MRFSCSMTANSGPTSRSGRPSWRSESQLWKLKELPRPEELPRLRQGEGSRAILEDFRVQLQTVESVTDRRAISIEDLNKRRFACMCRGRLAQARPTFVCWKPDLEAGPGSAQASVLRRSPKFGRRRWRSTTDGYCAGGRRSPAGQPPPGEFAQSGVPPSRSFSWGPGQAACSRGHRRE